MIANARNGRRDFVDTLQTLSRNPLAEFSIGTLRAVVRSLPSFTRIFVILSQGLPVSVPRGYAPQTVPRYMKSANLSKTTFSLMVSRAESPDCRMCRYS